MPIELPSPPPELPADTYAVRHRAWWEQCDVLLRQASVAASEAHGAAQLATAVAMQAHVDKQQGLIDAMNATPVSASGFSETFVMSLLRLVLDKPEPAVG